MAAIFWARKPKQPNRKNTKVFPGLVVLDSKSTNRKNAEAFLGLVGLGV